MIDDTEVRRLRERVDALRARWIQNVLKDSARVLLKLWEAAEPVLRAKHDADLVESWGEDCESLSGRLTDIAAMLPEATPHPALPLSEKERG